MRLFRHCAARRDREGAILIWAVLLSFMILTSSFVLGVLGRTTDNMAQLHLRKAQANGLAEAAADYAVGAIEEALRNSAAPPTDGEVVIDGTTVQYRITEVGAPATSQSDTGLNQYTSTYRVEGVARAANSQEVARRIVQGIRTPLLQFAMFFENDLEFSHPAEMTVSGRVHTNGKLYIRTKNPFTFDTNYIGAVNGFYARNARTEAPGGTVSPRIRRWVADPFDGSSPVEYVTIENKDDLDDLGIPSTSGFDSSFAGYDDESDGDFYGSSDMLPFAPGSLERWSPPAGYVGPGDGHTLRTAEHGLGPVLVPELESFDMFTPDTEGDHVWNSSSETYEEVAAGSGTHVKGPFHSGADLSILRYPDGSWKAFDSLGIEVTGDLSSTVSASSIYDARQAEGSGDDVSTHSIDLSELGLSGRFPANGLIYVAGYGAGTGTDALGFQFHNGAELHGPLTIVSPNSVYLQGDYNTVSKQPACVLADAVNLLSNAWDGSKESGDLPTATSTTYNVSVVTGDVEEVDGVFQGSAMNVLRRHERWTGKTEHVLGSIVCMFRSRYATGTYSNKGDYFRPPIRAWTYDVDLNSLANLPPFTPQSVEVRDLVSW